MDRPEMTPLAVGKSFKTLHVSAKAGMKMPSHHTTKEAVIVVQKGEGVLKLAAEDRSLKAGDSFIIGAGQEHSLEVKQDFEAVVTMAVDGEIEFPK